MQAYKNRYLMPVITTALGVAEASNTEHRML